MAGYTKAEIEAMEKPQPVPQPVPQPDYAFPCRHRSVSNL